MVILRASWDPAHAKGHGKPWRDPTTPAYTFLMQVKLDRNEYRERHGKVGNPTVKAACAIRGEGTKQLSHWSWYSKDPDKNEQRTHIKSSGSGGHLDTMFPCLFFFF